MSARSSGREQYLVRLGGSVFGPLSAAEAKRRYHRGEITPIHEISADDGETWISARSMVAFLQSPAEPAGDPFPQEVPGSEGIAGLPLSMSSMSIAGIQVSPALVVAVAGALVTLTLAMPAGRELSHLVWIEEPTPVVVSALGLALLVAGVSEAQRRACPSTSRAAWMLVAVGLAASAGVVGIIISQGAWGLCSVATAAVGIALVPAWDDHSAPWAMAVAGVGAVAALVAGAVAEQMAMMVTALLPVAAAALVSIALWGAWPRWRRQFVVAAGVLAAAGTMTASILCYLNSDAADRFLVLDGARLLLVLLCILIVAVMATRERRVAHRSPPRRSSNELTSAPA
ncbi:MAG: hypothetical protein O2819_00200 [Planctomycetota bacterium]|nr:hypothetical protein [Planctomycetota bacterium]MDA1105367.1 hypothetical protein [Planctomycetota bacterium]